MGNKELAKKLLGEAASIAPTRRNLYYVGVNAYVLGEYDRAVAYFEKSLKAACGSETEADFGEFMLSEARSGIKRAQAAIQKQGQK